MPKNEGQEPPDSYLSEVIIFTKKRGGSGVPQKETTKILYSLSTRVVPSAGAMLRFTSEAVPEVVVRIRDGGGGELLTPSFAASAGASLARWFLAKMVLNIFTTAGLHERLLSD